jgi:hypothetical protein
VQTPLARTLLGDLVSLQGDARVTAYRWFTDPASRDVYARDDHGERARFFVAELRAVHARDGDRSRAGRLVAELLACSPEFAGIWAEHEVRETMPASKRFVHPEVGELTLDCQTLLDSGTGQRLLVFTARPGTEDAQKLALLGVIGTQQLGQPSSASTASS